MANIEFKGRTWEDKFPVNIEVPEVRVHSGVKLCYVDFTDKPGIIGALCDKLAMALASTGDGVPDTIVTMESKGIPYANTLAQLLGINEIVILTKKIPLGEEVVPVTVRAITHTEDTNLYLKVRDIAKLKDASVVILDDVVSTGSTLNKVEELVREYTDKVKKVAICKEGEAYKGDLIFLGELPFPVNG